MKDVHSEFVKYPTGKIGKSEWCDVCKKYNSRRVTVTTIGVKDGKVLMVYRAKDPEKDTWTFPGGYVDWDETAMQAAGREFKEESGFEVKNLSILGVYSDPSRDPDGRQNIDICFYAKVGKKIGGHDKEVVKVKWFDLDKLPERIGYDHRQMFGDYKKRIMNKEL